MTPDTTDQDQFGVARLLGRLEKQLEKIEAQLGGMATRIAEQGVRIERLEQDVSELKATGVAEQQHQMTGRQVIAASLAGSVTTGLIGWLIQVLTVHH